MYMTNQNNTHYAQSEGIKLLEFATKHFGPIFTIKQLEPIAVELHISQPQLRWVISLLARSSWIEMIKRGTYAVKNPIFGFDISPFAIAAALVQPIAISHWSALAHHGFTTQLPKMVQASTPRKVLTPQMRIGETHKPRGRTVWRALDVEVEFINVQYKHFFGHQQVWINEWQQVSITDPERTALDLIARSDVFGGMSAAVEIFEGLLSEINISKLIQYGMQYNTGAVIKRLGWVLEQLGVESESLNPLQAYAVTTYYRLDPRNLANKQYNPRWRIIENIKRKDD
jgi:predicted transcriptional regulator of viral defense system